MPLPTNPKTNSNSNRKPPIKPPTNTTSTPQMCTATTHLHRGCQHATVGTAGPSTQLAMCPLAIQSSTPCPPAQQFLAGAIDFQACEFCDRCLLWGALSLPETRGWIRMCTCDLTATASGRSWHLRRPVGSGVTWTIGRYETKLRTGRRLHDSSIESNEVDD
jgi:hypothetical protein